MSLLSGRNGTVRSAQPALERVLFALSEGERDQMFPGFRADALLPAECAWTPDDTLNTGQGWEDFLRQTRPTVLVTCWTTPPVPMSLWTSDDLPLRYICHVTGTVKKVAPREFLARGGIVTNWGTLVSHNVAEHAVLLILACLRNLPRWHPSRPQTMRREWGSARKFGTLSLQGKKVGIHGFGNIARALVRLLEPFGVSCAAFSEGVPAAHMTRCGVRPCASLEELFDDSQIIVECEALTARTAGSVKERHFRLLPDGGVFVNIARAAIVDEAALNAVVKEGRLRLATDVLHREPPPEDALLFDRPDFLVSPHIAGPTSDLHARCGELALENLHHYFAGEPLEGVVTPEIYDRST